MEKLIVVAVTCPICGHHLVGHYHKDEKHSYITAYCPLCDNEFKFDEDNLAKNKEN